MKIGINLFLWSGQSGPDVIPVIKKLGKMGYDGIEFPIFHHDESVYRELRTVLDDLGMGATGCTVVPPEANLISETPEIRRAGVDYVKRALDMCALLKCDVLCGPLHSPVGRVVGRGRTDEEWEWAVEGLKEVGEHAIATGVCVAVEYLNRFETYFINTAADTKELVRAVGSRGIRMMMDTFHSHIEEKNAYEAWKGCGKLLAHVHASENDRGVPGTGQVAWEEVFKALREIEYGGWCTIESFGTTVPEIARAAAVWRQLSPSNDVVARDGLQFLKKLRGRKK